MAKSRVERRVAAILAADVVGDSRLMGATEEGTSRLNAHRHKLLEPTVAQHRGHIFKGRFRRSNLTGLPASLGTR